MNIPVWVTIIACLFGAANVAGSTIAIFRGARNKARAQEQHDRIDELQGQVSTMATMFEASDRALEWERRERGTERENCRIEVAQLKGQVETLQSALIVGLVDSLKAAMASALQEVLGRSEKTS